MGQLHRRSIRCLCGDDTASIRRSLLIVYLDSMDGRRRGPIHLPPEGMRGRRTSPILIVLALFVSAWILYQRPAALWRPRTFDEDPLTPIRLPDMHVQRVTLKADEDHLRVKVDAPGLDGTSGWKARTWVRVK